MRDLTQNWEGTTVKRFLLMGFAVVLASCEIFAGSQGATAAVLTQIDYSTTGPSGPYTSLIPSTASANLGPSTFTIDGVTISVKLNSNDPGTLTNANVGSTANLTITGTTLAPLTIAYSATGFTAPTGPVLYSNGMTLSQSTGTSTASLLTYVDNTNLTVPGGASGNLLNAVPPLGGTGALSQAATGGPVPITVTGSGSPAQYSIDEVVTLSTTNADTSLGLSASINAVAVPEPASILMLGFGAAGMLGYGWKRRKVTA